MVAGWKTLDRQYNSLAIELDPNKLIVA